MTERTTSGASAPRESAPAECGVFTMSLDFELYWGAFDHTPRDQFREKAKRTLALLHRLLDLFDACEVKATFATVGLLFARNLQEALDAAPSIHPQYENEAFSAYPVLKAGRGDHTAAADVDLFAPESIALIADRGHEIGSHSFAHVYCQETGMTDAALRADLTASREIASRRGHSVTSLVFPRNQYQSSHTDIAASAGFTTVRGNPDNWLYHPRNGDDLSTLVRLGRLIDDYLPVSGHNCHPRPGPRAETETATGKQAVVLKASRFLRPWTPVRAPMQALKHARIRRSMTYAASHAKVFHLWWHPHNFANHTEQNFAQLERVLKHFCHLRQHQGMECLTMAQLAASEGQRPGLTRVA